MSPHTFTAALLFAAGSSMGATGGSPLGPNAGDRVTTSETALDMIPTIIISDRTSDPAYFDTPGSDERIGANMFRYSQALNLAAYVYDSDTPALQFKYLFSERDTPESTAASSPSTIAVDGMTGSPFGTTQADVDGAGASITFDPLDFRNIKYSPGTGTAYFPAPPAGSLPESRTLRLYVSDGSGAPMLIGDFTVITTNEDGSYDHAVPVPRSLFLGPEITIDTFDNWNVVQITSFADLMLPGSPFRTPAESVTLTGASPVDVVDLNDGATRLVAHQSVGSAYPSLHATLGGTGSKGLAVLWSSGGRQAPSAEAGMLHRIRWTLTSPDATTAAHSTIRFRVGDYNRIGSAEDILDPPLGPSSSAPFSFNTWFVPKGSGTMPLAFDVMDFSSSTSINASLESVSINHTDRFRLAAAGNAVVSRNVGNPSFAVFTGEPAPDSSAVTGFPAPTTSINFASLVSTNRPVTMTVESNAVTQVVSSRNTNPDETFTTVSFGNPTGGSGFIQAAPGNTVIVTDLWASAPAGASDSLPVFRFGHASSPTHSGVTSLAYYGGQATENGHGGAPNAQALQSTSRRYTHAFQPQVGSGAVDYRFDTNILVFDNTAGTIRPVPYSGTVRFDRVTVTEYTGLPDLN